MHTDVHTILRALWKLNRVSVLRNCCTQHCTKQFQKVTHELQQLRAIPPAMVGLLVLAGLATVELNDPRRIRK